MNTIELLNIIASGETSTVQFKEKLDNNDSIAAEMIAFANSKGGKILFGVEDKTGSIKGLDYHRLQEIENKLATIASDSVKPQIFITTEVITLEANSENEKRVLIVDIAEGGAKPYKDKNGAIWQKQGSDKRRVTDNNEQIRLFQQSGIVYVDEMIVPQTFRDEIDDSKVAQYLKMQKGDMYQHIEITETLLANLNIIKKEQLTLGGLLFFAKEPQKFRPSFCVKAVSFLEIASAEPTIEAVKI